MSRNTIKNLEDYFDDDSIPTDCRNCYAPGALCIDCDLCDRHCKCNEEYWKIVDELLYDAQERYLDMIERKKLHGEIGY